MYSSCHSNSSGPDNLENFILFLLFILYLCLKVKFSYSSGPGVVLWNSSDEPGSVWFVL